MSCNIAALMPGDTSTFSVRGVQDGAGDNSLIGVLTADDPRLDNNADLESAQIAAALSEGPTQTIALPGTDVAAGDLNGDGEIDVVATGGEATVYFNNGSRALTVPGVGLQGSTGASAVTLLDWNGDSHLDIALGGMPDRTAAIFINNGSGTFGSTTSIQANVGAVRQVAASDFNSDGRAELVIAGANALVIASNNDQDTPGLTSLSTTGARGVSTADIDRDGDFDIVGIRASDRMVEIYANNGSGSSFNLTTQQFGSVAAISVADIDSDGTPDLLLGLDGADLQPPQHKVAYQQGDGQFATGQSFGASPVSGLLTGDINADGWMDIAAINATGVHQVYLGSSQGSLSLASEQLVSNGMRRGLLTDFSCPCESA